MLTDRRVGDDATNQLAAPAKLRHDAAGICGWRADVGAISVDELVGSRDPEGELDVGVAQRVRKRGLLVKTRTRIKQSDDRSEGTGGQHFGRDQTRKEGERKDCATKAENPEQHLRFPSSELD